jgi:hypothetical protein
VVVDEEVVLVGRRMGVGEDVDERPAGVGEVDGPGRQLLDGILEAQPLLEGARVRLADGVGQVESRLLATPRATRGPLSS